MATLDNVSGSALDGCVKGSALGVFRGQRGYRKEVPAGSGVVRKAWRCSLHCELQQRRIEVAFHTTKTLKIVFHDAFRLALRDTELLRKTKGRQTIHKTVGHGFDATSSFRSDLVNRDVENAGTNIVVQVFAAFVGIDQAGITRKVCHHAHFNLGIVSGQQSLIAGSPPQKRNEFCALPGCGREYSADSDPSKTNAQWMRRFG